MASAGKAASLREGNHPIVLGALIAVRLIIRAALPA